MVRIISYRKRQAEDGTSFFVLELQGGLEMVRSQETNQFYATARKAFISSTFDEATCNSLIGTSMPGKIATQECEPYQITVKETGEIKTLTQRAVYMAEGEEPSKEDLAIKKLIAGEPAFSLNGVHNGELSL